MKGIIMIFLLIIIDFRIIYSLILKLTFVWFTSLLLAVLRSFLIVIVIVLGSIIKRFVHIGLVFFNILSIIKGSGLTDRCLHILWSASNIIIVVFIFHTTFFVVLVIILVVLFIISIKSAVFIRIISSK
jgi:hypothetical protein